MFLGLCIFIAAHVIWAVQPTLAEAGSLKASPLARQLTPRAKPTGPVAASWYTSWHAQYVPLTSVNWTQYNMVFYSFLVTTSNSSVIGLQPTDVQLIPQFVQTAHQYNVLAIASVGGWGGSQYFSSAVATDANRTAFATAIVNFVSQYQLDGIEIDWEYPGKQGIGCNVVSPSDSDNFLLFLQTLRGMSPNLILSAAVSLKPFLDSTGNPMSDVSGFANVLDYIEIMNYDVWGGWSATVGPNAPLNDTCAPPSDQQGSAVSALQAWTQAGFPANKAILGVAAYGHSFSVNASDALNASGNINLYPPFNKTNQPAGDMWDSTASGVDACGNPNVVGGIFTFWGLIVAGFLTTNGTPSCGVQYTFDNCSQTPFVYNSTSEVMVSYDDATSFAAKGTFIRNFGLAGFSMYETGGDYNNILVSSIRSAMQMTP